MYRLAIVSLALLLASAFTLEADHCRSRVVIRQDVHDVQAVAVVPIVNLAIPAYSAGYSAGQPGDRDDPDLAAKVKALQDQLDRIERLLSGQRPPEKVPAKAQISADQAALSGMFGLVKAKCAVCHSDLSAASKGGGFVMLRGNALVKPNERRARLILTRTFDPTDPDAMPPASALKAHGIGPTTDEEFAKLIRGISVLMSR